jgi:hypothetical protein
MTNSPTRAGSTGTIRPMPSMSMKTQIRTKFRLPGRGRWRARWCSWDSWAMTRGQDGSTDSTLAALETMASGTAPLSAKSSLKSLPARQPPFAQAPAGFGLHHAGQRASLTAMWSSE